MNKRTIFDNPGAMADQIMRTNLVRTDSPVGLSTTNKAINDLIDEGGDSFYNYVEWRGLIKDPDLIVLSSVHHYFFDNNELKNINTIINIKQLNLIKNIDLFFRSVFSVVPPKSNLIGCFLDNKTQHHLANNNILSQYHTKNKIDPFENGITSRIPFLNMVYNLMDSKTNRYMTRRNVSSLLEGQHFKVLDMTELNGLIYFHSQKTPDYIN